MSKTCLVSVQKSLRGDDTWSLSLQNAVAEVARGIRAQSSAVLCNYLFASFQL